MKKIVNKWYILCIVIAELLGQAMMIALPERYWYAGAAVALYSALMITHEIVHVTAAELLKLKVETVRFGWTSYIDLEKTTEYRKVSTVYYVGVLWDLMFLTMITTACLLSNIPTLAFIGVITFIGWVLMQYAKPESDFRQGWYFEIRSSGN